MTSSKEPGGRLVEAGTVAGHLGVSQMRTEMSKMEARIITSMDARLTSLTRRTVGMIIAVPALTVALQAFIK
ncbi:MAG: hypothetical protein WBB59_01565 [Candidatus Microthrix parvicella]